MPVGTPIVVARYDVDGDTSLIQTSLSAEDATARNSGGGPGGSPVAVHPHLALDYTRVTLQPQLEI